MEKNKYLFVVVGAVLLLVLLSVGTAVFHSGPTQRRSGSVDLPSDEQSKPLQIRSIDPRKPNAGAKQVESSTLYITEAHAFIPVQSLTVSADNLQTVDLYIDTASVSISGYDITVSLNGGLLFQAAVDGTAGKKFNTEIFHTISSNKKTLRLSKVTTDTTSNISGKLHIATITFRPATAQGGSLSFSKVAVTSPLSVQVVPVTASAVPYEIH